MANRTQLNVYNLTLNDPSQIKAGTCLHKSLLNVKDQKNTESHKSQR